MVDNPEQDGINLESQRKLSGECAKIQLLLHLADLFQRNDVEGEASGFEHSL